MSPIPGLIRASHPLPALAVTVAAAALAAGLGQSALGVLAVTATVLAGQLSVGWLNDLVDADRDARVGRADKPVAAGEVSRRVMRVAVAVSASGALVLGFTLGWRAAVAHGIALVSAWAYDLGVKATAASVVPYAVSFGLLTGFVTYGLPDGYPPPWWLVATAALLGSAAHFANAIPDFDDDRATGVRGLPHRLGVLGSRISAGVLVFLASVALVFGLPPAALPVGYAGLALAAVITVAGLLRGRRPGSRAAFNAMLLVAVIDAAVLVAASVMTT